MAISSFETQEVEYVSSSKEENANILAPGPLIKQEQKSLRVGDRGLRSAPALTPPFSKGGIKGKYMKNYKVAISRLLRHK